MHTTTARNTSLPRRRRVAGSQGRADRQAENKRQVQKQIAARMKEIEQHTAAIARLVDRDYSDNEDLHWGHAGNLEYVAGLLKQAEDFLAGRDDS